MMEHTVYSYHIFYFPFKWNIKKQENELFEKKVSINNINPVYLSNWERSIIPDNEREQEKLYNEQNYYYEFVHNVLYDTGKDNSLVKHYERKEPEQTDSDITYRFSVKNKKTYVLHVDDLSLNFYSTGVGILTFYLRNNNENQKDFSDIKLINQFGRRIMPPFFADIDNRDEIAENIIIEGLNGGIYEEDFNHYKTHKKAWQPASFIKQLIADFSPEISIVPVIDDRMIVNCWYTNNELSKNAQENIEAFKKSNEWYSYIFVDSEAPTCQNIDMRKGLIDKSTNCRWDQFGTIYGVTRFSMMVVGNDNTFFKHIVYDQMRTTYSRMVELVLVQQASMLKFSEEVTIVSGLNSKNEHNIAEYIGSLYKAYIRFMNQIYFRQVTVQDQGIELYQMMQNQFNSRDQIKDLNNEISELHQYYSMLIDKKRTKNGETLSIIAAIFLPATLIASIFGMNPDFELNTGCAESGFEISFIFQLVIIIVATILVSYILIKNLKK